MSRPGYRPRVGLELGLRVGAAWCHKNQASGLRVAAVEFSGSASNLGMLEIFHRKMILSICFVETKIIFLAAQTCDDPHVVSALFVMKLHFLPFHSQLLFFFARFDYPRTGTSNGKVRRHVRSLF